MLLSYSRHHACANHSTQEHQQRQFAHRQNQGRTARGNLAGQWRANPSSFLGKPKVREILQSSQYHNQHNQPMKTPITDPNLRQRIQWQIEAYQALLDGEDVKFEHSLQSSNPYCETDLFMLASIKTGSCYPSPNWFRIKPTPKLRPFTADEARQLVGAVAVSPKGNRGSIMSMTTKLWVAAYGEWTLENLLDSGWKWKWPHEDDCQLRPFGKEDV